MCARTAEWILEREVPHQPKRHVVCACNRTQLKRRRIFLGRMPHVVEFDVTAKLHRPFEGLGDAEMNFGARSGVFIIAIRELRGAEILADFESAQNSVGRLDRLEYQVKVDLAFRDLLGRFRGRVRMHFELQMTGPRRARVVNLDFVEIDRMRWSRSRKQSDHADG
jgi:hypothetical protein